MNQIYNILTKPLSKSHPVVKFFAGVWITIIVIAVISFIIFSTNIVTLGIGGSMSPTYGHCSVVGLEDTNIDTVEEGDIVRVEKESGTVIIHRVHTKYTSYNPDTAKYHITEDGKFWDGEVALFSPHEKYDGERLEGKTVIVTKGDNNSIVDPELFTQDDLKNEASWSASLPNEVCPF